MSAGSASITVCQVPTSASPSKISSACVAEGADEGRVELRAAAPLGDRPGRGRRRRCGGRPRRTPRAGRSATRRERRRRRAHPASPCRPTARRSTPTRRRPSSGRSSRSASWRASAACWASMSSTSRRPETANSMPVRSRCSGESAGAEQAHHAQRLAGRARLVVELGRLQGDVVAEPLRLLVGVGVAADVHQQRAVVDGRPSLVVEADPLGDPQRDQALPQDVLHRLAEAQVDPQRQRGHDLGEPNRRALRPRHHQLDVTGGQRALNPREPITPNPGDKRSTRRLPLGSRQSHARCRLAQ